MLIIKSDSNDAYFNIASEEYILDNFSQDVFLLYINKPSIIVGKYQNTISQLNLEYIKDKNVKVVRRLTGGGAVFHDLGNLNFSFICKRRHDHQHSFDQYTEPVLGYLKQLGVKAELKGRNDLVIDDRKFSGNARLATKNKILQHGTLLYSAQITDLSQALKVDHLKFKDKSVKSVRSRVTNISDHMPEPLAIEEFEAGFTRYITESYTDAIAYQYSDEDIKQINKLSEEKFQTWEWNFGASPRYNFNKTIRTAGGTIQFRLLVEDGLITDLAVNGDFFTRKSIDSLINSLIYHRHDQEEIARVLTKVKVEEYFINVTQSDILCAMF